MSRKWFEEDPSEAFRDRVEHRANQLLDDRRTEERYARRTSIFQILAGLSFASVVGVLLLRRKIEPSGEVTLPGMLEFMTADTLIMDLLEEEKSQAAGTTQEALDLDFLADLEMFEYYDEFSELSDDDLKHYSQGESV